MLINLKSELKYSSCCAMLCYFNPALTGCVAHTQIHVLSKQMRLGKCCYFPIFIFQVKYKHNWAIRRREVIRSDLGSLILIWTILEDPKICHLILPSLFHSRAFWTRCMIPYSYLILRFWLCNISRQGFYFVISRAEKTIKEHCPLWSYFHKPVNIGNCSFFRVDCYLGRQGAFSVGF